MTFGVALQMIADLLIAIGEASGASCEGIQGPCLQQNPLDLVRRERVVAPVAEVRCARRFVAGNLPRFLEGTAVLRLRG